MPLLPRSYLPIKPDVYYPAICPKCGKEVSGPYVTGRSHVGVYQAVYRCAACNTRFAIRYSPHNPSNQILMECRADNCEDYRPDHMRIYLLIDKAKRERPAFVPPPSPPDSSANPDSQAQA